MRRAPAPRYRGAAMEPARPIWIPWALVALGAALSALYVRRVLSASINAAAFASVMRRLLSEGNADRALKLCLVVSEAPLAAATRAAILACRRGVRHDPAADYRSAGDLSPERVLAPVRADYDAAFDAPAAPVRRARYAALFGVASFGAAIVLSLNHGSSEPWPAIVAALGLVVLAWLGAQERRLLASRDAVFAMLRDLFEALVRDPARAPSAAAPTRVRVGFEVSEPGREPRVVETGEDVIKVGSLDTAQVRLDARGVARMHAVIERSEGRYSVIDLGSDASTLVNGERVNRRELSDGDVLSVGEAELRVRLYR